MRTKITLAITAALIIGIVGILAYGTTNSSEYAGTEAIVPSSAGAVKPSPRIGNALSTSTISTSTPAGIKSYTYTEISKHTATSTCWIALDGYVYDITSWVDQYQGGRAQAYNLCGKDATSAFLNQYGALVQAQRDLADFEVGIAIKDTKK